jgi:hypothetical protein
MIDRRSFMTCALSGWAGAAVLSNFAGLGRALAAQNEQLGKRLIVLWMEGGPSQIDTFDPKPGTEHGGPFTPRESSVSGIRVSEHLPLVAREMKSMAVVRSVTSKEGNHPRARYLLHTGYSPAGTVKHPGIGSVVCRQLGSEQQAMPAFVSIGGMPIGSGFLGSRYAPFSLEDAGKMRPNIEAPQGVDHVRYGRRLAMLSMLEDGFKKSAAEYTDAHAVTREKALSLMRSEHSKAFDISSEPAKVRAAYGESAFGSGVLMARRLVEAGVQVVEVALKGWDTHEDNFDRVKDLCRDLDPAMATLIKELRERGMLDDTLVVWMGEFGRTPRVNPRNGRDHFPRAYSVALAGGGIRGGQVVGETSKDGMEVRDRPVTVPELFATIYRALGVPLDHVFQTPQGRPISIVDSGGVPMKELI